MNKEERVVKYINSSDDPLFNGKRYCENDFYNDVEDLAKENQKLKKENKILRENAENNDKVVDKINWENLKLKEVIEKSIKYIGSNDIEVLKYHDIPSETTSYEIVTIDLLKILRGDSNK